MSLEALFEQDFAANCGLPDFRIRDALIKGADGEYWHQHTRQLFKYWKLGYEKSKA